MDNEIKENIEVPPLSFEQSDVERLLSIALKKIENLEDKFLKLETNKLIESSGLSREILENNNLLPTQEKRTKTGKGHRPILRGEIEEAQKNSTNASMAARYIGVSLSTYRKYCDIYGIYKSDKNGKRKSFCYDPNTGAYPISGILENKYPHLRDWNVKDKLIRGKIFPAKCNICGYDKRRIGDNKIALLLDHIDGDRKNFKRDNLQLLCLNCTFECGRGYIRSGNKTIDVDWLQGASVNETSKIARW